MSTYREMIASANADRDAAIAKANQHARAEFPIGAKVRWIHTFKYDDQTGASLPVYREGVVESHTSPGYIHVPPIARAQDRYFSIKMKSGKCHELSIDSLEIVA